MWFNIAASSGEKGAVKCETMALVRLSTLALTQRYVETNSEAMKAVVNRSKRWDQKDKGCLWFLPRNPKWAEPSVDVVRVKELGIGRASMYRALG